MHAQLCDVCHIPVGLQVTTCMSSHICRHKCVRHLCQDKCSRDQNWHFECSFDFPSPINVYELELRTTANYNHPNTGKTGISGRD